MELWQAVLWWLAGCAGRFVLPYVLAGLQAVGEQNTWKAWPAWEWKLLTAFLIAAGFFGISLIVPATRTTLVSMSMEAIIMAGYIGLDLSNRSVKAASSRRAPPA